MLEIKYTFDKTLMSPCSQYMWSIGNSGYYIKAIDNVLVCTQFETEALKQLLLHRFCVYNVQESRQNLNETETKITGRKLN